MDAPTGTFQCAERGGASPLANKQWVATGEFRAPLAGEWYIIVRPRLREARRSHLGHDEPQWIAREVAESGN